MVNLGKTSYRLQLRSGTAANAALSTTYFENYEPYFLTDTAQLGIFDGTNKLRVPTCDSAGVLSSQEFKGTTDSVNRYSFSTWKTGTPGRNNFDGSLGFTFTPLQNITINQLGRYYGSGNTQNHVVSVYNMGTSALVVRGTVLAASTSDSNGYKWVSIADTALSAGTIYAITVDENNGGDTWFDSWDSSNYFSGLYINRTGYAYGSQSTFPSTYATSASIYDTPAFRFVPSVNPQLTTTYTSGPSAGFLTLSNGDAVLGLTKSDQAFSITKLGIGRVGVTSGYALDVVGDTQLVGNVFLRQSASATGLSIRSGSTSASPTNTEIRENAGYLILNSAGGPMLFNYNTNNQPSLFGASYTITGTQVGIQPHAATTKGLIIKGTTAQSANLLETQDISGNTLLSVTKDGQITFTGAAQAWDDLRVEPVARTTGSKAPSFEKYLDNGSGSTGVYLYSFDDAAGGSEKEVFFTIQMPHAWNGDDIHLHVHWIPAVSQNSATPRWGLEYTWVEPGGTFGNTTIVYATGNEFSDTDLTANKHYITEFAALSPTSSQDGLSSVLICRLFRNSSNAADTYNTSGAKCGLLYVDAHYQIARIGSALEYTA